MQDLEDLAEPVTRVLIDHRLDGFDDTLITMLAPE